MKDKKQYRLKRWYPDIPSYMDNGFIIDYYPEDEKAIYTYPNGCILGFSLPAHHLECRDFWELIEDISKCEAGCVSFCDRPMKHHKDCVNYIEENKPKPLFVTDDGVELFDEADKLFIVNKECYKKESKISNIYDKTNRKDFKYFYVEENADEYIWKNKRVFSYEDMMKAKHSIILTNEDIEKVAKKRSRNE